MREGQREDRDRQEVDRPPELGSQSLADPRGHEDQHHPVHREHAERHRQRAVAGPHRDQEVERPERHEPVDQQSPQVDREQGETGARHDAVEEDRRRLRHALGHERGRRDQAPVDREPERDVRTDAGRAQDDPRVHAATSVVAKFMTRLPSTVAMAPGTVSSAAGPVRIAQVASVSASAHVGRPDGRLQRRGVGRRPGPRVDHVVQARPPGATGRRRRRERAAPEPDTRRLFGRDPRILDRHVDPDAVAGDAQIPAGADERPGHARARRGLGRQVRRPSLRHAAEVQPDIGRESQPSGAHVDLGPSAARLWWVQDTPRAGEHLVVVAVVAGGDHRVQHGRVEETFRAFRLTEREPDEPLEPGAHVRPSAGVRVHRRELAVAAEPREPLLLASEDVRDPFEHALDDAFGERAGDARS